MSLHVPELARITDHPFLASRTSDGNNGAFDLSSPEPGWRLSVICSDGTDQDVAPEAVGWEHVSVHAWRGSNLFDPSARQRTPTWKEMVFVKDLFWDGEDVVMQLHPRRSQYVNCHPFTLHLWRPRHLPIPTPPSILVGPS